VIFEDESSVAPGNVAPRDAGSRFQLSIWVGDVDAECGPQRFSIPPDIAGNWHSG
jgi:hypothetical protein